MASVNLKVDHETEGSRTQATDYSFVQLMEMILDISFLLDAVAIGNQLVKGCRLKAKNA